MLVPLNTRLTAAERAPARRRGAPRRSRSRSTGDEADVPLRDALAPAPSHSSSTRRGTTAQPKPGRAHATRTTRRAPRRGRRPRRRRRTTAGSASLPLFHVGGLAILIRSAIYGTAAVIARRLRRRPRPRRARGGRGDARVARGDDAPPPARGGLGAAPGAARAPASAAGPSRASCSTGRAARGLPAAADLRDDGDRLADRRRCRRGAARLGAPAAGRRSCGRATTARSSSAARWSPPRRSPPTAGSTPATAAGSTPDGSLQVEGRIGDTIVTGGENVAAAEVEEALLAHPAVARRGRRRACPTRSGARSVDRVRRADRGRRDRRSCSTHCRERLAGYKVPKRDPPSSTSSRAPPRGSSLRSRGLAR